MGTVDEAVTALRAFKNAILEGPPGTGKSHSISEIASMWPRPLGVDAAGAVADGSGAWAITFHPSSGYEEFVEGIRYNPEIDPATTTAKGFELRAGVFRHWVNAALSQPDRDFLVLIDEINRANVSRVLGDLLLGLEASKRVRHDPACARTDGIHETCWSGGARTQLAYSNEVLGIPENLYVLGTMNSSDRSIAPLDSALRRRFAFVRVNPLFGEVLRARLSKALPAVGDEVIARSIGALDHLNAALGQSLGPDGTLGHSYLFELDAQIPGLTGYWMEVRSTTGAGGEATQVQLPKKDWVDALLTAIASPVSAGQMDNGTNAVPIEVEYDGRIYKNVKLDRIQNYRLVTLGEEGGRLPVAALNDGVMVLSPLGVRRLRLEYQPFNGAKDTVIQSYRDRSFAHGMSKNDASGRSFGVFRTFEAGRGDEEERTVWRYSILPQLIDTVTQAYAPDLLVPARRAHWVQENIPDIPTRTAVLDALDAFDLFLNGVLRYEFVRAGHGLSAGLLIKEFTAPPSPEDASDEEPDAEADDGADGSGR
jgi:MoxR-like ATPase